MQVIRFISILFYVILLTIVSWFINGKVLIGIDDANIYMVYMRNFANGHGFVYNIGGEKVEGFTSLLWTLLGSIFFYISNHAEKLLLFVNVIIVSYTLHIICNYVDRDVEDEFKLFSKQSLFFLATIGVTPGFIDWTVLSLMESGLWCFLLTSISLKTIQYKLNDHKLSHYSVLNLLYVLLIFCRPESMLLVPFFILLNSIKEYFQSKSIRTSVKWTFFSGIFFISALLLLISWRLDYFGYPLPNTYYAKVSNSISDNIISGLRYLHALFIQKPFFLGLISLSCLLFIKVIKSKNISANLSFIILFSVMMVSLGIPLYSGGDHFGLHRFIMPFIPIIVLLGVVILKGLSFFQTKTELILLFFLLFFSNDYNLKNYYDQRQYPMRYEFSIAVDGRSNANKLNDFFKTVNRLPSQGVLVAGGTAYGYKGETIDLLGLNNTKMAHADKIKDKNLPKNHASFNSDVFFELLPDLFWYSNCGFVESNNLVPEKLEINTKDFYPSVFKNIQLDKRFKEGYGYYRIDNIYNENDALLIFASKTFMSSIDTSIYNFYTIQYE